MKILFVADRLGWSWGNIARGYQAYSKHQISLCDRRTFSTHLEELNKNNNLIVFMLNERLSLFANTMDAMALKYNTKVIIGLWTSRNPNYGPNIPKSIVGFVYGDKNIYNEAQKVESIEHHPKQFLPEGIDHNIFISKPKPSGFTLGWAGKYEKAVKRTYLLKQLNYPVKILTDMKQWLKILDINGQAKIMAERYNQINGYVYVSEAEGGQSTTILETMSCGLPIISTDAGSEIKNLLEPCWIVPTYPESTTVKTMNQKLKILAENPNLQISVGQRNRRHLIDNQWTWMDRAKLYDETFCQWNK